MIAERSGNLVETLCNREKRKQIRKVTVVNNKNLFDIEIMHIT